MNDIQNVQTSPSTHKSDNTRKLIIVGIIIVGVFILFRSFMSPERALERAIEQASEGVVDVDIDRNGNVQFKGEDGESYNVSAGEDVSLPDNWPASVPIISGAKITYAGSMMGAEGEGGTSVMFTTSQKVSDVSEYYKSELESNGWSIQGVVSTGDGTIISGTKSETENVAIYVAGDGSGTSVNISVQQ